MAENRWTETDVDLPAGLSRPARRALEGAGYIRLEQLAKAREADVLKLHGMGPKAMELLRQALADKGLSFAEAEKG
ncbi:DNA-binding protein [Paenibacillus humicola]|uniref:DNA-binding protein n=1 Tax=Paenibacillus humicola TaxID=3110540 RepID=UPI00237A2DCB|nr:DNA-binding protein [Paenibacillus humicola]